MLVGRVGEDGRLESIDLVIHVRQDWEEAVDQRIEDAVEQELLAVQHATIELFSFVVQGRKRVTMHRHEVSARDEEVHLAQRFGVVAPMAPRAVEDDEHVIPVLVELGALGELLGVLERERMKSEELMQLPEIVGARAGEVEPKETVAPQAITETTMAVGKAKAAAPGGKDIVPAGRLLAASCSGHARQAWPRL